MSMGWFPDDADNPRNACCDAPCILSTPKKKSPARRCRSSGLKRRACHSRRAKGAGGKLSFQSVCLALQPFIKIIPVWIDFHNGTTFPRPFPAFHPCFTFQCRSDLLKLCEPDKPMNPVSLGEDAASSLAMFMHTSSQIIGNADIERAIGPACQNIDPIGFHL